MDWVFHTRPVVVTVDVPRLHRLSTCRLGTVSMISPARMMGMVHIEYVCSMRREYVLLISVILNSSLVLVCVQSANHHNRALD